VPGAGLVGFVADRVSEVLSIRERDITNGTVRVDGRARRLFEPDRLLSGEPALSL
jgi:hypothetical protein